MGRVGGIRDMKPHEMEARIRELEHRVLVMEERFQTMAELFSSNLDPETKRFLRLVQCYADLTSAVRGDGIEGRKYLTG